MGLNKKGELFLQASPCIQLETLAREKGSAIGFVNATPAVITRLARCARDLERRGVALAPVSALAAPPAHLRQCL